jgi:hypothetical protein
MAGLRSWNGKHAVFNLSMLVLNVMFVVYRLTTENTALATDSRLAWALDRLQEDVQWTLSESSDILTSGQDYAKAMDDMLNNASRRSDIYSASAWGGDPPGGTITLTTADTAPVLEAGDSICAHSETLSRHVTDIQEQLKTFADLLKETGKERALQRKEKEKTWEGFLWNVLYVGLRFIANLMKACAHASTATKYGALVSVILGEGSKLANAAAELCRDKGEVVALACRDYTHKNTRRLRRGEPPTHPSFPRRQDSQGNETR